MDFLRTAWEARTARERGVLALGAIAVVLLLLYQYVWSPLVVERERLRNSIVPLRVHAAQFAHDASEAEQLRTAAHSRERDATPTQTLQALAERNDLRDRVKSVAESPDGRVQVTLEPVPYETVVRWLGDIAQSGSLAVESLEMKRTSTPGVVQVESLVLKVTRP
jgi:general secretion pathway protein M